MQKKLIQFIDEYFHEINNQLTILNFQEDIKKSDIADLINLVKKHQREFESYLK